MNKPFFTGVCTALVTPFLGGEVNYPMLERLLRRQMDAGIRSVVICGTTGEAPALSDGEKLELFRRAREYVGDSCQILAGTGSNCTEHSVALSAAAEAVGADGLLLVSPYYNKSTPDGLIAHYSAIASSVHIPCILYNVPGRTGQDIPLEVYEALCKIPNIAGVKEASADVVKVSRIITRCPSLSVWSGNDDNAVASVALGAKGVISVLSNVAPEMTVAMMSAALDGDFDTAAALHNQLLPLMDALFCQVNPVPVKAAMKMIGFDCGSCRLPLGTMDPAKAEKLKDLLPLR